jgi:hypothetical protein
MYAICFSAWWDTSGPFLFRAWVKAALDEWVIIAQVEDRSIFGCVSRTGSVWGPQDGCQVSQQLN